MEDTIRRNVITLDMISTKELYNHSSENWVRKNSILLSDYTARPAIFNLCEPLKKGVVLDLGCGEGYCSRELMKRGAEKIFGIDVSEKMIDAARDEEQKEPLGIEYNIGDATNLSQFLNHKFDLVVAVFLFNYLDIRQTEACMKEVIRVLKPEGRFVFSIPHPAFPFMRHDDFPFYFSTENKNYFNARNQQFQGKIWRRDRTPVNVQLVHKTMQDFFDAMRNAGFTSMPIMKELHVEKNHLELDSEFFEPLIGYPLHIAFSVSKSS